MPLTTAPVPLYTDPAVYDRERKTIFAKAWLFLGLEADLVRSGDYLADDPAGYPVMVVRDQKGALWGFHNVCRHRAGPLVGEPRGRCDREFVCRYHAWRYAFDGALTSTGDFTPPDGFDAKDYGLFAIRVETWRGFIFINLDLNAAPLIETLQPLETRFGAQPPLHARLQHSHPITCNWKVYVENYLDGYHLEGVHPVLVTEASTHRHDVHMEGLVALHDPTAHAGSEGGFWAWVWPNLGICLYRGVLLVEHMRPDGPDRMRLDHLYLHEPEDPGIDAATSTSERITDEDAWICERVQRNLDAGVYEQGIFSPEHEGAVVWFQARVAEALAE